MLWALGVYLVLWTIYGTIAKSSQGLHYDMTEVIAWSRDLSWATSSIRRSPPPWSGAGLRSFR